MTIFITVLGNLGKDPEMFTSNQGNQYCQFSIAGRSTKKDEQGQYQSEWFRISVFGNYSNTCMQALKKGSKVMVMGDFSVDRWIDKNGSPAVTFNIKADKVQFLDNKEQGPQNSTQNYQQNNNYSNQNYQQQQNYQQPQQQQFNGGNKW